MDTSKAEGMPGFVQVLKASDIPGKNTFVSPNSTIMPEEVSGLITASDCIVSLMLSVQLFLDINRVSQYAGQAVGLVLAGKPYHLIHMYHPSLHRHSGTGQSDCSGSDDAIS